MNRSFLQIMREAYVSRKAGLSVFTSLASTMDDDDWETLWQRLMQAARLDKSLQKYRPRGSR